MLCPYCIHTETKVVDKRDDKDITKRRRECLKCGRRFNTQESCERTELRVVKKDGRRENFDHEKLKRGIMKACEKRAISTEKIDKMIGRIEGKLWKKGKEIKSDFIGEEISKGLKKLDNVAYIRFASVYKDFTDLGDFKKEIRGLIKK